MDCAALDSRLSLLWLLWQINKKSTISSPPRPKKKKNQEVNYIFPKNKAEWKTDLNVTRRK